MLVADDVGADELWEFFDQLRDERKRLRRAAKQHAMAQVRLSELDGALEHALQQGADRHRLHGVLQRARWDLLIADVVTSAEFLLEETFAPRGRPPADRVAHLADLLGMPEKDIVKTVGQLAKAGTFDAGAGGTRNAAAEMLDLLGVAHERTVKKWIRQFKRDNPRDAGLDRTG